MSLPYYREFGWDPTVLAVRPDRVEGAVDPELRNGVPTDISVIHAGALSQRLTRLVGFGSLALRSLMCLARTGNRLLRNGQFDLVFFSSTVFLTFCLGPYWLRRFGVPYVVDYQDPWISDFYATSGLSPPGGRVKYYANQFLGRVVEGGVLRQSSGIISVSPAYPRALRQRYPDLSEERFAVIPFGAPERDFAVLSALDVRQHCFDPTDGLRHWVYTGRGGPNIERAAEALFLALKQVRTENPEKCATVRIHFIGTSYVKGTRVRPIQSLADSVGVGDLVEEMPERIPYFEALKAMRDSDALLVLGTGDPGYTASKIYPCILAKRPLLAIFHEKSTVVEVVRATQAGSVVTFDDSTTAEALVPDIVRELSRLMERRQDHEGQTDWGAFAPYTARELTRAQCAVFKTAVTRPIPREL